MDCQPTPATNQCHCLAEKLPRSRDITYRRW